jgi:hypothetical protein
LPVEIAVLSVRTIAEIGPQPMHRPALGREDLPLRLEARVCVPELGRKKQPAIGFGAAGVDVRGAGVW